MLIFNFKNLFLSILMLFLIVSCNKQRTVKAFYDDGALEYEMQILNNDPHGTAKYYYPNGKLKDDSHFEHGKINGKSLEYFENGNLYKEIHYVIDKKHGWEINYNKDKTLHSKVNWVNGRPVFTLSFNEKGDTLSYSANDKKTITFYEQGKIFEIICKEESINFKSIRLNYDGSIKKYNGPLTCLTKRDSMLLFAQNPNWISEIQARKR